MDNERLRRIRDLFQAALDRDPADRALFLAVNCADDDNLRGEVEKLLIAHDQSAIIDRPALHLLNAAAPTESTTTEEFGPDRFTQFPPKTLMLAAAGLALVFWFIFAAAEEIAPSRGRAWSGFRFHQSGNIGRVTNVTIGTPASRAGIRRGDLVQGIDGKRLQEQQDGHAYWIWNPELRDKAAAAKAGEFVTYRIRRGEEVRDVALRLEQPLRNPVVWARLTSTAFAIVMFVAVGLLVLWKKPRDERSVVFFLLCVTLACALADYRPGLQGADAFGGVAPGSDSPRLMNSVASYVIGLWVGALVLHFALCFPTRRSVLTTCPRLRVLIHGMPIVLMVTPVIAGLWLGFSYAWQAATQLVLVIVVAALGSVAAFRSAVAVRRHGWAAVRQRPLWPTLMALTFLTCLPNATQIAFRLKGGWGLPEEQGFLTTSGPAIAWVLFAFIAACGVVVHTYRTSGLEQRKQIQWPVWSLATYALIGAVANTMVLFRYYRIIPAELPTAALVAGNLIYVSAAAIIPLSIAAAIMRYRLMDIQVLIRRTAVYGVLSLAVLTAYLLLAGGIGGVLVRVAGVSSEWVIIGSTLAVAGFLAPVKTRIQTYVDSRFFPAGNGSSLVSSLSLAMSKAGAVQEFLQSAAEEIQRHLNVRSLIILERASPDERYRIEAAVGVSDSALLCSSVLLPPMKSRVAEAGTTALCNATQSVLRKSRCEYLVAITDGGVQMACLALGRRLSNAPLDAEDQALLTTVADQIALGLRTIRLRQEQAHFDSFRRDVLSRTGIPADSLLKECPKCGRCGEGNQQICNLDGTVLEPTLPLSRTLNDRYRLERRIGAGGMGVVYEAIDLRLNRTVALKVMLGKLFGDRAAMRRLDREARAVAALRHPNVVDIYDFGLIGADGAYLVMPRLYGRSWRSELQKHGSFPPHLAAERLDALLSGLEAAHAAGIAHCDLKPENLLITPKAESRESVIILDFGLARMTQREAGATVTSPGMIAGTPGYVAPEQLQGDRADSRSDVFAVGVLTVESLTGQRPFDGISYNESPRWHTMAGPEHQAIRSVLTRCLTLNPEQRIADAALLRAALIGSLQSCVRA